MRIRFLLPALVIGFALYAFSGQAQDQPRTTTTPPIAQVPGSVPTPAKESTPAVVTTTIPSPASPTHVPEQVIWALAMSYVMQFLKKQKWFPLLTEQSTANVQAGFGFLVALATAAGIHIAVSGSVLDGSGLSFSITGLTVDAIKDVGFQWVAQQGWYDALVKSRTVMPSPPNT
jgi:hypothetical protein